MKKRLKIQILCGLLATVLIFAACSPTAAQKTEATPSPTPVPVERTESVTLPESVMDSLQLDVAALSRRLSLYNVTENIDGSCTVHMTQEEKDVILPALRTALDAEMEALVSSGTWPFLTKAEISADAAHATLHTAAKQYDPVRDRTCAASVYLPALLYAAFTTDDAESFTLQFTVLDEKLQTIDEYVYPFPDPTPAPEVSESLNAADTTDTTE